MPRASAAEADRITSVSLAAVGQRLRPDGRFDDPRARIVGDSGLPPLAWSAFHLAPGAPDAAARIALGTATLERGSGGSVLQRWPLAMLVADDPPGLSPGLRADLRARVAAFGGLYASGIADRCYRDPTCFNNYAMVDRVLSLELARSGVRSRTPGTRLLRPRGLRREALRWLGTFLPTQAPATARVTVPGRHAEAASILSDRGALPLAYHTLCTGWVVRAMVLAGGDAPPKLRVVARRTLWALVGLAAPDGEVSWSGRGQDQAWSLAATLYAASQGSRLFARSDPLLAARLRRLADVELAALGGRLRDGVLQVLPSGNDMLDGLDSYYSGVGSTGLALQWLGMARDVLPPVGAVRRPLPSEIDGGGFSDAARTGIVSRRVGGSWLGVRLRRDHALDPRQDFGLLRALRRTPGGWVEDRVNRPGRLPSVGGRGRAVPSGGPLLETGSRTYRPVATSVAPVRRGLQLRGEWRSPSGKRLPGRWRITASALGETLSTRCGGRLQLTEWLPRTGTLMRGARSIRRAGYRVSFSAHPAVRELGTLWENSRQPALAAARVLLPCRAGAATTVRWSGGQPARG